MNLLGSSYWPWELPVPALLPLLCCGLIQCSALSCLFSPVCVTEAEYVELGPCFLGKSASLAITLSSGTRTDVQDWPLSLVKVAFPASPFSLVGLFRRLSGPPCCVPSTFKHNVPSHHPVLFDSFPKTTYFLSCLWALPVQGGKAWVMQDFQTVKVPWPSPASESTLRKGHQGHQHLVCLSLLWVYCDCLTQIQPFLFKPPSKSQKFSSLKWKSGNECHPSWKLDLTLLFAVFHHSDLVKPLLAPTEAWFMGALEGLWLLNFAGLSPLLIKHSYTVCFLFSAKFSCDVRTLFITVNSYLESELMNMWFF